MYTIWQPLKIVTDLVRDDLLCRTGTTLLDLSEVLVKTTRCNGFRGNSHPVPTQSFLNTRSDLVRLLPESLEETKSEHAFIAQHRKRMRHLRVQSVV